MSASLAIIAALDDEVRIIASKMEVDVRLHRRPALFRVGRYGGMQIVLARSGVGPKAMAAAAAFLLAQYRPAFCLHVGYCGGTNPQDQAGDLIVADAIVDAGSGERFAAKAECVERALLLCRDANLRARSGALVTVEKAVEQPHEKAFVGTQHEAIGIDMESAALAAACAQQQVASLVVRAVFDPLDVALPDMCDILADDGTTDGIRLAEHLIRRPQDLLGLPRLQYFASQARSALARFIEAWVAQGER